ncbi:galactokinase [Maribacter algarum]|uniref:Galactokinase n=1 Tax=Maribacter algarum (ex Zhang et al. 2020) TaxID=2578118 RepID=A0A5S3PQ71_9FLAO|nr:galactokinase [Maribacter algarum]TMM56779.1 galactokinase [Maribacter algarum]
MQFLENFKPELTIASPGRINFIGEHTDYNMGYVLPTAIGNKITFKLQKNGSGDVCNIYSVGYEGFSLNLNNISISATEWENYVLGVLNELSKLTDKVKGFDCTIESDLPLGSGLSSSAAMECGLAYGLNELFDLGLSKITIVELSQRAEHSYVGTQCGIMDQFASVMSKEGNVILLDCESLAYQHIPIDIYPYKIIMLNTKVEHTLASSEYNTRKQECEEGVATMKKRNPHIKSLRDATRDMLEASKNEMTQTVYNRCSFIIDENKRVLEMVEAFKKKDLKAIGNLLYKAHHGISKLYEVSCPESDFLVDFAKTNAEVLGARQTGGGFGGCTLNIVHEDAVEDFRKEATNAYKKTFNIDLEAFEVQPSGGTSII